MRLLCDVDMLVFELECAIDNLHSVHTCAEEDGGVNWQLHCNSLFSAYLRLNDIHKEFVNVLRNNEADTNIVGKKEGAKE